VLVPRDVSMLGQRGIRGHRVAAANVFGGRGRAVQNVGLGSHGDDRSPPESGRALAQDELNASTCFVGRNKCSNTKVVGDALRPTVTLRGSM